MAFTLYSLLQAALLCVNAIAVLHEERFLKNSEWDRGAGLRGRWRSPRGAEPRRAAGGDTLGRDRREAEGSTPAALPWREEAETLPVSPSLSLTAGRRLYNRCLLCAGPRELGWEGVQRRARDASACD